MARHADTRSENRLEAIRREAERTGRVGGDGVRALGGPMPERPNGPGTPSPRPSAHTRHGSPREMAEQPGYYGRPVLKPPVWTWEIPTYFFVGGLAGASAVLAWAAGLFGAAVGGFALERMALWIALIGAALSASLLIMDLGRPMRFLYMLRVFKWRSPMSVGVWVLSGFGGFVTLGVVGVELRAAIAAPRLADILLIVGTWGGALFGSVVATYTGVLIGATVVPAWNRHRALLPIHFGMAGLGSAAALLQLLGHRPAPLWALGVLASAVETLVGLNVELRRHGAADRALRMGHPASMLRGAGLLAGPCALALYLFGLVPWAAGAFLLGALVSRFGWLQAGRASARDPQAALEAAS